MHVFIAWSGNRSKRVALALQTFIRGVLHVEVFCSPNDIDPSEQWAKKAIEELQRSTFIILCLTEENLDERWIYFEAGALAGRARGSDESESHCVVPLLIDLELDRVGTPLSIFQSISCDADGVEKLLRKMNDKVRVEERQFLINFDAHLTRLMEEFAAARAEELDGTKVEASDLRQQLRKEKEAHQLTQAICQAVVEAVRPVLKRSNEASNTGSANG